MTQATFGKAIALSLTLASIAGCGAKPLAHLAAPLQQLAARSIAWPPASLTATVQTISGGHTHDDGGYVVNVPAAQARYNLPNGLTFANGKLYVSDARNSVVTVLADQDGTLFASSFVGTPNPSGDVDGTGAAAQFSDPQDLATGPDGTLYMVEYHGDAVRAIKDTSAGGVASTVIAPSQHPVMAGPYGIAVGKSGTIYVSDLDKKQVVKIAKAANGRMSQTVLYKAKTDADPVPLCLTVDDQENVYFGSFNSLYMMSSTGQNLTQIVAHLPKLAWDLAYANGHLVVADLSYVLDVDLATRAVQTLAGSGAIGGDDGVGAAASFGNAASICFGEPGTLYVADGENHRICRLTFN